MFFIVWYLYFLLIIISFYTSSIYYQISIIIIFYFSIQSYFCYSYYTLTKKTTPLLMEQFHKFVQHGDILNTTSISIKQPFYGMYRYFNYGIAHCLLIIEENGEKFVLHTHPNTYPINPSTIIQTFKKDIISPEWHLIKEPLRDFLHTSEHSLYHIYRPPSHRKPIRINYDKLSFSPRQLFAKPFYYCTLLIADLLVSYGHIPPAMMYYPYRTDELVQALQKNGYHLHAVSY